MRLRSTLLIVALAVASGCGGGGGDAAGGPEDRGARIYAIHCASCHERDGRGLGEGRPALAGATTVTGDPEALIAWVLLGRRPATLPPGRSVVVMPRFDWLSDQDLAAVLTHVRTSFGNSAGPVTAADVAAVRTAGTTP